MGDLRTWRTHIWKPISIVLDWYWRFIWLIIGVVVTGVVGNYVYTYSTTCKSNKPDTCKIYFTDPRQWPIITLLLAHPQQTIVAAILFVILTICAGFVHHQKSPNYKIDNSSRLKRAKDLRRDSLISLGEDHAANFYYIITPIQEVYNKAIQVLRSASTKNEQAKRGILIFGESNSGKTRLALEATIKTLSTWPVLIWKTDYRKDNNPLVAEATNSKCLVLFIDDLQEYVPSQVSPFVSDERANTLHSVLEMLIDAVQRVVVVATCRTDSKSHVQTALPWLFDQLRIITMPPFSEDTQDLQTKQIITEFQRHGTLHKEDWDGTLGSLILGLSRKNIQYVKLVDSHPFAATVLKAMKLLRKANTTAHTKRRIQAACAGVFGKEDLQKTDIWRESIDRLISLQFIAVNDNGPERTLIIRKDAYFEKVVTDYPQDNQPDQIEQDFKELREVFVKLTDTQALSDLSMALATLKRYDEAMEICNQALSMNPNTINAWLGKAVLFFLRDEEDKALVALDHAVSLDPHNVEVWLNKGILLHYLEQDKDALAAVDHALSLNPKDVRAWLLKGIELRILAEDKADEEALKAFDQATFLDPMNVNAWLQKGIELRKLGRHKEALVALNQTLSLDPENARVWLEKGCLLESLGRYKEALVALNQTLSLDPENAHAWRDKAKAYYGLVQHEEALKALDHALSLDPENIPMWVQKGLELKAINDHEGALAAFDHAASLDLENYLFWHYKTIELRTLGREEEALASLKHALSLLYRKRFRALARFFRFRNSGEMKPPIQGE